MAPRLHRPHHCLHLCTHTWLCDSRAPVARYLPSIHMMDVLCCAGWGNLCYLVQVAEGAMQSWQLCHWSFNQFTSFAADTRQCKAMQESVL